MNPFTVMCVYVYTPGGVIVRGGVNGGKFYGDTMSIGIDPKWFTPDAKITPDLAHLSFEWRTTHANLKRAVFELRRVLVDGDGALEARVVACLGIKL